MTLADNVCHNWLLQKLFFEKRIYRFYLRKSLKIINPQLLCSVFLNLYILEVLLFPIKILSKLLRTNEGKITMKMENMQGLSKERCISSSRACNTCHNFERGVRMSFSCFQSGRNWFKCKVLQKGFACFFILMML